MRGLALLSQPHRTPQRRRAVVLTLSCTALLLLLDDLACLHHTTSFHTHGPWRMTHMAAAAGAGTGAGAGRAAAGPRRSTVLRHGMLHPLTMLPAAAAQHDNPGDFKAWHVEDDPMEDDDDDYDGDGPGAAGAGKGVVQGQGQGEPPRCAPAYQGMVQHSKASCKAHLYTPGLFKMLADDRARQMGQSYLVGSAVAVY